MSEIYVEISAVPDVEGFEISGVDNTEGLYQLIDTEGGSMWFLLIPAERDHG